MQKKRLPVSSNMKAALVLLLLAGAAAPSCSAENAPGDVSAEAVAKPVASNTTKQQTPCQQCCAPGGSCGTAFKGVVVLRPD